MFRNLSSNWSLVPGPFFDNFVYKKGLGSKEKLKLPFLRLADNPLSKYFTFKIISCTQWLFWVIYQIIKMSETSFCCTFSVWFLYKNFLYLILNQGIYKVSMSYLFPFSGYQTKCVIEFLFRQLMTSWTLRFIFDNPLKQWPTGRKRGKDRNTKNWISREWKELFRWNKKHFS